ncbi:hypothetical protein Glove_311g62 [Diversispora epigaea]|uniref:Protein kinase domain-containing protein n=1 Tax=Diversispora epigaea TaxID=1348612 RepID=A0A397HW47_9GLOM|nr:hypothetical protein Glove_311g62 [Diversispora epigaea]
MVSTSHELHLGLSNLQQLNNINITITCGLHNLQTQNLVHRDLHSGDILTKKYNPFVASSIIDLGLCSFGGIMYEMAIGKPFYDRAHDTLLLIDICNGLRPKIPEIMLNWPKWYSDLTYQCWSGDFSKRPN